MSIQAIKSKRSASTMGDLLKDYDYDQELKFRIIRINRILSTRPQQNGHLYPISLECQKESLPIITGRCIVHAKPQTKLKTTRIVKQPVTTANLRKDSMKCDIQPCIPRRLSAMDLYQNREKTEELRQLQRYESLISRRQNSPALKARVCDIKAWDQYE